MRTDHPSSMTIWKFPVRPDLPTLRLPKGARILCVQTQAGEPQLWVLVDKSQPLESRRIRVYGTGWEMDEAAREYLGTFQVEGGALVFHVFEEMGGTDANHPS